MHSYTNEHGVTYVAHTNARGNTFVKMNKGADDAFGHPFKDDLDAFMFLGPDGKPFPGMIAVYDLGYMPQVDAQSPEIMGYVLTFWLEPLEGEAADVTVALNDRLDIAGHGPGGYQVHGKAGAQWWLHRKAGGQGRYLRLRERPGY